jgi:S-adenosylmethionine hydrolase
MKGVLVTRAPEVRVVDVTHGVPPQDVLAGALVLRHAAPYFPPGTLHVAVVDPGVGGARRPLCVETGEALFVGPDNGLLSLAATSPRRIIHLTDDRFFLRSRSATFHGRDVFAPVAAALATGTPPRTLGTEVPEMVRLEVPEPHADGRTLHGQVIYVDHFGNLVTNVRGEALPGTVVIAIGDLRLRGPAASYSAAPPGEAVTVVNSWGLLEIAVRDGSARQRIGAEVGASVTIDEG